MPSIKQSELDELRAEVARANAETDEAAAEATNLRRQASGNRETLEKILRAIDGRPIVEDRSAYGDAGLSPMLTRYDSAGPYWTNNGTPAPEVSTEEKLRDEIRDMHGRIVGLESRLAAARAVAAFAKG